MLQPTETRKPLPVYRPRLSREELLDLKRKKPNLRQSADMMLPANMILMTDTPIQAVRKGLICRIFTLRGALDNRKTIDQHFEYFCEVADHIQMQWAMDEFEARLALENTPAILRTDRRPS